MQSKCWSLMIDCNPVCKQVLSPPAKNKIHEYRVEEKKSGGLKKNKIRFEAISKSQVQFKIELKRVSFLVETQSQSRSFQPNSRLHRDRLKISFQGH